MIDLFGRLLVLYGKEMTPRDFSDLLNDMEEELFRVHPEYLKLSGEEQDKYIEEFFKERYGY